jgi:hypothetical protein
MKRLSRTPCLDFTKRIRIQAMPADASTIYHSQWRYEGHSWTKLNSKAAKKLALARSRFFGGSVSRSTAHGNRLRPPRKLRVGSRDEGNADRVETY